MTSKTMSVSQDIGITYWTGSGNTEITSKSAEEGIIITPTELPALIAALQEAAEAMGVATAQGEMVKACESALCALETLSVGKARDAAIEQLQQALASVKR